MEVWLTLAGMVLVTYSVRLSVMALLGDAAIPDLARRALRYVPPAALAAIVFPALFMPSGTFNLSLGNARLIAGGVAVLVAWYTRSTLLPIAVGMAVLWALTW